MLILAVFAGIILGIATGLTPGLHINAVSALIISNLASINLFFNPVETSAAIFSMSITHTFLDTIPSTFLGAPEGGTALSVLPAHTMLMSGKGKEAVALTIAGSLGALLISSAFLPIAVKIIPVAYPFFSKHMAVILIVFSAFLIFQEKRKWCALAVFALSGSLGYFSLNSNVRQPLFSLLSGLFGASTLAVSLKNKTQIPNQKDKINVSCSFLSVMISVACGWLCAFLPGIGASHAAAVGSSIQKSKKDRRNFLVMIGGINTSAMLLSLAAFYSLHKKRNGSIAAISNIIGSLSSNDIAIFVLSALIAGGVASLISAKITHIFSKMVQKVNYSILCSIIIISLATATFIISGTLGLAVFVASSILGVASQYLKIRKSNLMGSLIIPVIIYFIPSSLLFELFRVI